MSRGFWGRASMLGFALIGGSALVWAQSGARSDSQAAPNAETRRQTAPKADVQAQSAAPIDQNSALVLIRSVLLAVDQANETGNYTVLRDLAAPGFRDNNSAARLGDIFASERGQKLDLSSVAVLQPQLTVSPEIQTNGMLHMAGIFPTAPSQIAFELLFTPVDQRWRLFGIAVDVKPSTPPGPQSDAAPAAQAVAKPAVKPAALK